ncbi:MAG: hypothetical protein LBV74_09555 [Tannerella sp.]|nr:hypothetical protein [Tannerella sp.]
MKKILTLTVILSISLWSMGQQHLPTLEDYQRFLKSKTMVVYDDVKMSEFNMRIKQIMERSWNITPVEYITLSEFNKLKNNPDLSFLMTTTVTFDKDKIKARYNFVSLLMGQPNTRIRDLPDLCSLPLAYYQVDEEVYSYKLEAFIQFLQAHAQTVLENPSLIGDNGLKKYNTGAGDLADKTLYLIEKDVAPNIRSIEKVKANYPYAVKFVTEEEVEEAIANRDKNVVFLHKVGPEQTRVRARVYKLIVGAGDSRLYWWDYEMVKMASDDAIQAKDLKKMGK